MEFYQFFTFFQSAQICFNSQRDGILRCGVQGQTKAEVFQFPTGWNSTARSQRRRKGDAEFQFPTGWNSTYARVLRRRDPLVFQFPTGWNSTRSASLTSPRHQSFNSQRDGILQAQAVCYNTSILFQFPTGWNSTRAINNINLAKSFNSQRDGILHFTFINTPEPHRFQFPTGWNSTMQISILHMSLLCFNSQRDGILPLPIFRSIAI